jgi:hypothetical protein
VPGDEGVFHLRAFVCEGLFTIASLDPERSENAPILESERPLRAGELHVSFTESVTGNTSIFTVVPLAP